MVRITTLAAHLTRNPRHADRWIRATALIIARMLGGLAAMPRATWGGSLGDVFERVAPSVVVVRTSVRDVSEVGEKRPVSIAGLVSGVLVSACAVSLGAYGTAFAGRVSSDRYRDQPRQFRWPDVQRGWRSHRRRELHHFPVGSVDGALLTGDLPRAFNLSEAGLLVQRVVENSPADKLGLRGGFMKARFGDRVLAVGGDVILQVQGMPCTETHRVYDALAELKPGDRLVITVLREGQLRELSMMVP